MTLDDWLNATGTTEEALAQAIGRSQACVNRYRRGKRIPARDDQVNIFCFTGGSVTPNDFFDLPELPDSASAQKEAVNG